MKRKKRNSVLGFIVLFVLMYLLCAGCGKKEAPVQPAQPPKPAQPRNPATAHAGPAATQKQFSSAQPNLSAMVQFDFAHKKDPFRPAIVGAPTITIKGRAIQGALPILSYDSSRFVVKGIITGLRQNKALILDPTGKAYVVNAGMAIGVNNGTITKITNTTVEIVEKFRDDDGKLRKRIVKLTLAQKGKETSR